MEVLLDSPVRPLWIILAKMIPYFFLSCINLLTILLLARFALEVPMTGSMIGLIGTSLLYILLALALGLFISTIARTQVVAMLISGMVLILPVIMLSGMVFPIENMPGILQGLSCIIPARWYIQAVRKLMIERTEERMEDIARLLLSELEPGEEKTVTFTLAKRAFAYYRTDISDWYVESGDYTIMAAKSSRDIACTATVNVTSTTQIKRVYTMNSTIEEIMESPVGREILGKMMAQNPLAQADADDIGMGEAMARMMAEMPLRALLSFGGDSVPAGAGEMLLKQLNA